MRIVLALGGNALLERGQRLDAATQVANVRAAVEAFAPLATDHELIITHGNGPQVGLLAAESAADDTLSRPYPFDTLGAETQGLIGYWLVQSLENALPHRAVAGLITQTLVAADDPAFSHPTKFVGAVYSKEQADRVAAENGWTVKPDGKSWRRVVPSPDPIGIVEVGIIRQLVTSGTIVVCAGGGGAPVVRAANGELQGVEAVLDKDLTACMLADSLDADTLLLLTDVRAVEDHFGFPDSQPITRATPEQLRARSFPEGSMGPKVEAVCRFVESTGRPAAIGSLRDVHDILRGEAGTIVSASTATPFSDGLIGATTHWPTI